MFYIKGYPEIIRFLTKFSFFIHNKKIKNKKLIVLLA